MDHERGHLDRAHHDPGALTHLTKTLLASLLLAGAVSAGPRTDTFVGTITDDMCATEGHAQMQMGPTDADCTRACVSAHGAQFVLHAGTDVYVLSDQKASDEFAGQRVRVVGTLDAKTKTIHVDSITTAP